MWRDSKRAAENTTAGDVQLAATLEEVSGGEKLFSGQLLIALLLAHI